MSARVLTHAGRLLGWPESKRLGARVRLLRDSAGIKVKELAPRVRVSPAFLSELERGHNRWREDYAGNAAAALGTSVAELLGGDAG